MIRFTALTGLVALALVASGCGAANTSSLPAIPRAADHGGPAPLVQALGTALPTDGLDRLALKPIPLPQGQPATDAQANPKLVRVKKLALETIEATNEKIAAYNKSGDLQLLVAIDNGLIRGLTMVQDVLEGDPDPAAAKILAVVEASFVECNEALAAYKRSFFKTRAKGAKVVLHVLDVRSRAVERVLDLCRVATGT